MAECFKMHFRCIFTCCPLTHFYTYTSVTNDTNNLICFWRLIVHSQAKKLPAETDTNEGYVTDEDEGAEPEKKRNSKRVSACTQMLVFKNSLMKDALGTDTL